jgi:diguanylate cyclase (GGDEF)-like protein
MPARSREWEERTLRLIDQMHNRFLVVVDRDGTVQFAGARMARALGYEPGPDDPAIMSLLHPDDAGAILESFEQQRTPEMRGLMREWAGKDELRGFPLRLRAADGSWRWYSLNVFNEFDDPEIDGLGLLLEPSSHQSSFAEAIDALGRGGRTDDVLAALVRHLESSVCRTAAILRRCADGERVVGRSGFVEDHAWTAVLSEAMTMAGELNAAVGPGDGDVVQIAMTEIANADGIRVGVVALGMHHAHAPTYSVVEALGTVARLGAAAIELGSRADQLRHAAEQDALTGVANRRALEHWIRSHEGAAGVGVIAVDLDGFKLVNDVHGHAVGDVVLMEVAHRVCGEVRSSDLVARIGGDEFVVMCATVDSEVLARMAERIEQVVSKPVQIGGGAVASVGVSIGIATSREGEELRQTLGRADAACYSRKRGARRTR